MEKEGRMEKGGKDKMEKFIEEIVSLQEKQEKKIQEVKKKMQELNHLSVNRVISTREKVEECLGKKYRGETLQKLLEYYDNEMLTQLENNVPEEIERLMQNDILMQAEILNTKRPQVKIPNIREKAKLLSLKYLNQVLDELPLITYEVMRSGKPVYGKLIDAAILVMAEYGWCPKLLPTVVMRRFPSDSWAVNSI